MDSRDVGRICRVGEALEPRMAGVSACLICIEVSPMGGVKLSGLDREGGHQGIVEHVVAESMPLLEASPLRQSR